MIAIVIAITVADEGDDQRDTPAVDHLGVDAVPLVRRAQGFAHDGVCPGRERGYVGPGS